MSIYASLCLRFFVLDGEVAIEVSQESQELEWPNEIQIQECDIRVISP